MACATAMPMGAQAADNLAAAVMNRTPTAFGFAYAIQCISLGRHRGLVQIVNGDDSPQEKIISGRAAALVKEAICQYTTWSLRAEARFPGLYRWPGQGKAGTQQPQAVQQT
jgi:NADH dehydrogenase FAD-containing subunit